MYEDFLRILVSLNVSIRSWTATLFHYSIYSYIFLNNTAQQ